MNTEKPRIVITMEGGLITALLSSMPIDVAVIDYDAEGRTRRISSSFRKVPYSRHLKPWHMSRFQKLFAQKGSKNCSE